MAPPSYPQPALSSRNTMIPLHLQSEQDLAFMDEATKMAEDALANKEIPVGCVFVYENEVIARGRNRTNEGKNATLHAEFDALRHLLPERNVEGAGALAGNRNEEGVDYSEEQNAVEGGNARKVWETPFRGVTLFVTVEPCIMCASALRQIGIEKVVYGCSNDRFGGCGGVQSIHTE